MTEHTTDSLHQRILLGTQAGYDAAIRRARETGTPLVVWEDGKICEISAEEAARRRTESNRQPRPMLTSENETGG